MHNTQQKRHEFAKEATRQRAARFHTQDGTPYNVVNAGGTLERADFKPKGKRARKQLRAELRRAKEARDRKRARAAAAGVCTGDECCPLHSSHVVHPAWTKP